jgi:hypothetical protein
MKLKLKHILPHIVLIILILFLVYYIYKKRNEGFQTQDSMKQYTAIIVEPRKHKALKFVLLNVLTNLDDNWGIIIFHGNLNKEYLQNIIDTQLSNYKNRIKMISLNVDNLTIRDYNILFKTEGLYNYIPTETFLVFQTDSMIIPKNRNRIYDYLQYDYVGAIWPHIGNNIGNGGFSLRKKSKMLEIIKTCPYTTVDAENEDIYFSMSCKNVNINKPSIDSAKKFSSELVLDSESFGIHKCWDSHSIEGVFKIFPEVQELQKLQGVEN